MQHPSGHLTWQRVSRGRILCGCSSPLRKQDSFSLHLPLGTFLALAIAGLGTFVQVLRRPLETTPLIGNWLFVQNGRLRAFRECVYQYFVSSSGDVRIRRYTGRTTKIRNSGLIESLACGRHGAALFDREFATSSKQPKGASIGVNAPPQMRIASRLIICASSPPCGFSPS